MDAKAQAEGLETYQAQLASKPHVYYQNLYKWTKAFLAASVVYKDTDECAEGAKVTVYASGAKAGEGVVNNYSEFLVDQLDPDKEYLVSVAAPGYEAYSAAVRVGKSLNLGTILLERGGAQGTGREV